MEENEEGHSLSVYFPQMQEGVRRKCTLTKEDSDRRMNEPPALLKNRVRIVFEKIKLDSNKKRGKIYE
ncbi:MAG: hypothetical protein SOR61_05120 [Evtepia sp.]|nr:hypothetical protein [Evtepia sp.]